MTRTDDPSAELQAVKADLAALREDFSSLSRSVLRRGVRTAKAARAAVGEHLTEAEESVEEMVKERPIAMLAMAFGAGALLAMLLHRR